MSVLGAPTLLHRPEAYRAALELLRERHAERGDGFSQAGLTLAELGEDADRELSRTLARRVASGEYVFSPVEERRAYLGGKWRLVYRATLADTVVLTVLARRVTALLAPALSPRVYSYQKGRSSRQAVRELAGFVRKHRASRPLALRGLHVLRRDVARYGDSIPVGAESPLWPLIDEALTASGAAADDPLHRLLRPALCPVVLRLDGTTETPSVGVPMGSPLQPSVCNLYLRAIDRALEALPGAFYARFGDDLVFAHPDTDVAARAAQLIEARLSELGLELNRDKARDLFWNGAGRAPEERISAAERGTTHVEYLGSKLGFDGTLALSQRKQRRLRAELRERVVASERLLRDAPPGERARVVARAVSLALEPTSEVALPLAAELWSCDDRRLLRELDFWLARTLAQALSGRTSERAFRSVPYRLLREKGLVSLAARRDRARSARPDAGAE